MPIVRPASRIDPVGHAVGSCSRIVQSDRAAGRRQVGSRVRLCEDLADVPGGRAAAPPDEPRARAIPDGHMIREACAIRGPGPLLGAGIVAFTGIRIGQQRLVRPLPHSPEQLGHVAGRRAIHPERGQPVLTAQRGGAPGNFLSLRIVRAVAAREADPGVHLRKILQQPGQDQCLAQTGHGLAGDQVRAGLRQDLKARAVKFGEHPVAHGVVSAVFGAVREHCAIRSDGRRHQRPHARGSVRRVRPELVASVGRERDRCAHQARRCFPLDAPAGKALEGRLISGGGRDIGARPQVIHVHRADDFGRFDQRLGRPQRVAKIRAAALEFRRKRPVQHDEGLLAQPLGDRIHRR